MLILSAFFKKFTILTQNKTESIKIEIKEEEKVEFDLNKMKKELDN